MGAESTAVKGNPKSKVYHKPACRYYTSKSTSVVFKTETDAQKAGYKGCKRCGKPKGVNKTKKPADKKPAVPKEKK